MSKKLSKVKKKLINFGLFLSCEPTPYVVVANGGLGNDVSIQDLYLLLQNHGEIQSVSSSGKNSYACVTFSNVQSSVSAVNCLQGSLIKKQTDQQSQQAVIYLFFLTCLNDDVRDSGMSAKCELPPGLIVHEDFLSNAEEKELLNNLEKDFASHPPSSVLERLKHRTVLHYGYKFRYGSNDVDKKEPLSDEGLPAYVKVVTERLLTLSQVECMPDQMTVNKYEPGDGIPSHIDNPNAFGGIIITVSLGSPIVMEMACDDQLVNFVVKPRSVILFTKEARYRWTHGIRQKKTDIVVNDTNVPITVNRGTRLSLTFRKTLDCSEEKQSKSESFPNVVLPHNEQEAGRMEKQYVQTVYNNIAHHFSQTREKPWPRVVDFLSSLPSYSVVLDVGCGSGRYSNVCHKVIMFGCDNSVPLISICQSKCFKTFICDCVNIPSRDSCFDASISIAMLHHLSTKSRRLRAIEELLRVVKPGGRVLLYVWAKEQTLNNKQSNYLRKDQPQCESTVNTSQAPEDCTSENPTLKIHTNRTSFRQQDVLVPWKLKENHDKAMGDNLTDRTFYRFYHVFRQNELQNLCMEVPHCKVISSYYDNGNWAIILLKN